MPKADPDAIGPDGTVRLRCYLPLELLASIRRHRACSSIGRRYGGRWCRRRSGLQIEGDRRLEDALDTAFSSVRSRVKSLAQLFDMRTEGRQRLALQRCRCRSTRERREGLRVCQARRCE